VRLPRNGENRSGGEHPRGHGRPRTNGTNGAHPAGLRTRPISLRDPEPGLDDEEPIDLVAVQADDELINALAAGMTVAAADGSRDDHVATILAAWKAELDAEPWPDLVDLDTAVSTVQAARRPSGRARHLVPVAAAAAGLVILLGGVSLGSYSAEPDDALWPVTKVLYSERADSVEAAGRVEERIARAKQAIAAGQPAVAEQELRAAASDLAVVRPEEGRVELVEVQSFLQAKAGETPPGVPTDPGAPLAGDQARKVPLGAQITSPAARTSTRTSPADGPSDKPGTSGATSPDPGPPPAAPERVDPRILGDVPPAPVEKQPEVSKAPEVDSPPPAEGPVGGEDPGGSAPGDPAPPANPVPGADGAAPAPAPEGVQSIGATAADTSTSTPSPTS
jgi:hypothetical protein